MDCLHLTNSSWVWTQMKWGCYSVYPQFLRSGCAIPDGIDKGHEFDSISPLSYPKYISVFSQRKMIRYYMFWRAPLSFHGVSSKLYDKIWNQFFENHLLNSSLGRFVLVFKDAFSRFPTFVIFNWNLHKSTWRSLVNPSPSVLINAVKAAP